MASVEEPAAAEQVQPDVAPQVARRSRGRRRLVAAVLVALLLVAFAGLAVFANQTLSARYSPGRATLDYFAAQKRADAAGMLAGANFLRGDGSDSVLFGKDEITAMLSLKQNTDLSDVSVMSTDSVDSSTARVKVSMTWAGVARSATYTVRKDRKQPRYVLYNAWRVDVPYSTITVAMPAHAGPVTVDGVFGRSGDTTGPIAVIEGYHQVTMVGTAFYDRDVKVANAVDASPSVTFAAAVSATAKSTVAGMVQGWFVRCDATTHSWCPNHTYTAPNDGNQWYLKDLAGYGNVDYTTYSYTIDPDLISGMTITVTDNSTAKASGVCKATLTIDGSKTYKFTGTWSVDLTAVGSDIQGANGFWDCTQAAA